MSELFKKGDPYRLTKRTQSVCDELIQRVVHFQSLHDSQGTVGQARPRTRSSGVRWGDDSGGSLPRLSSVDERRSTVPAIHNAVAYTTVSRIHGNPRVGSRLTGLSPNPGSVLALSEPTEKGY